ncbi:MAG: hypothetical protein WHT06_11735 [Desulfobacterales bacterium]
MIALRPLFPASGKPGAELGVEKVESGLHGRTGAGPEQSFSGPLSKKAPDLEPLDGMKNRAWSRRVTAFA